MKSIQGSVWIGLLATLIFFQACQKNEEIEPAIEGCTDPNSINYNPEATIDDGSCIYDSMNFVYDPTPYNLVFPQHFPQMNVPANNPLTEEGIKLGRMLFYDPILSGDSTQACAGCHHPQFAFTDEGKSFSTGIDGIEGTRNAMAIINVGWGRKFFWDGRAESIEAQALQPVPNPIEMHEAWDQAVSKLQQHSEYPVLFGEAFGTSTITKELAVKAIAQFERTLISGNAKYDKVQHGEATYTDAEQRGERIFNTLRGDCFNCHGGVFFNDKDFHNNGLDSVFTDLGRYEVTGDPNDKGLFKTPTLRNIELTAPYMHDGRFQTLREVIDFYSEGVKHSPTIDPDMKKVNQGGLQLTEQEKTDLIAFLKTLTDPDFVNNPAYSNPFN